MDNLVKTLAIEWGSNYGIRINCVAPGTIVGNGIMNYPESVRDTILKPVSWKVFISLFVKYARDM